MDTQIDWQRELDASFGSGDDVPVGHYVAAGQQAVRRRRGLTVVAGLGAAAVVAGIVWGVAPGGGPRSDAPVATDPNGAASPMADDPGSARPESARPEPEMTWRKGDPPARSTPDGLEIRDGAVVHERRDDLYPGKRGDSVALDISYRGDRWWLTLEWDRGGAAMSSTRPEDGLFASFDDYVRAEIRAGGMTSEPASTEDEGFHGGLVMWNGGDVRGKPGVEVVRAVDDPVASADDSLGLVLREGGETTWMLITLAPSGSSASWSKESDSGWATFDEWLADQVALSEGTQAPQVVRLEDDGTVTAALPGVEVIDQQPSPDLRAYGTAAEGAVSAVALVQRDGRRVFVLAVRIPGDEQAAVTVVAAGKAGGATTLEEFVAFMADRADEGGMR